MARDGSAKERQRRQLARKQGQRASYDRILIVSEGSKSEPDYFREIRAAYRLHTANVAVHPSELGTEPIEVVRYAQQLFEQGDHRKQLQPRAFEQVYAVFDRDEHHSYFQALELARTLDGKLRADTRQPIRFVAVASVPCFELWLLLHFEEVHAPMHRDAVMRQLKRHLPGYEKGAGGTFSLTHMHLETATRRAQALAARFSAHNAPEPFTGLAALVETLLGLAR